MIPWTPTVTLAGMTPPEQPLDWTRADPLGARAAPAPGTPMPYHPPAYRPQPPPQPYRAAPPKKGMSAGAIVAIVLGSLVAVGCLGGLGLLALGAANVASTPRPTVDITSCQWDGHFGNLKYTLRNNDKRPHDYWVEATKGHTSMIPDSLKAVAAGEMVNGEMIGGSEGDCHITRVDQT